MLKLGVIGYGKRIQHFIDFTLREIDSDIKVVSVLDPDETGVRQRLASSDVNDVTFYTDLETMLRSKKIDGLMIGTRCNLHASYAVSASRFDIPLFLEKPVAISMEQASSLDDAFLHSKCEVVVSFPLRLTPLCNLAKKYIAEGAIGDCEHITALNYVPYGTVYWEDQYQEYNVTQGLFLQKATHDLDYMSYLMGSPIIRVAAMSSIGRVFGGTKSSGLRCSVCEDADICLESPKNRKRNGSGGIYNDHACLFSVDCGNAENGMNEDSSSILVEFASGAHGVYTQVFFSRQSAKRRGAIISGYHGTVNFDWYKNEMQIIKHHQPVTQTLKVNTSITHFGGDRELAHNFIDVMKGKNRSLSKIGSGIQSVYACLAAKESAVTGKFVNVRQTDCIC